MGSGEDERGGAARARHDVTATGAGRGAARQGRGDEQTYLGGVGACPLAPA